MNWAILGGFWGPNWPKNDSILLKLAREVDLKERNTALKFLGEILIFTETTPSQSLFLFLVLAQLWGPFTP